MSQRIDLPPNDRHNQALIANVHPEDWVNPSPAGRYNLVVLGAGTGGLITALLASSLGAKTALVERHLMGGDCLNVGCVPSKAVIRAAHMATEARAAGRLGLPVPEDALLDFGAAWERMREIRARISEEDAAQRYRDEFGVDVYLGHARFRGEGEIEVDGTVLRYAKAVIATGARAIAPPVPGLSEAGYLDNENVFNLTERPARVGVIGAGPIGCELAQTFRRLGSRVTIFERMGQLLTREDPDAAQIIQDSFARDGVEMIFGCQLQKIERKGSEKLVHLCCDESDAKQVAVDEILVGAGRAPNVEELGLDKVGVEYDLREGVRVDDYLQTNNPRIFAVGDVCMRWKFTHAAEAAAKIAVQNALFSPFPFLRKRLSTLTMPWCTYTDPEIAHVGLYERDARERGIEIDTYRVPITRANRAVTDGQEEGFVKVHVVKGRDEIVGATVVGSHAGDLITQLTLAITKKIGLGAFVDVIYPYPTQGEAIKRVAGEYKRTKLTPMAKRVLSAILRLTR